MAAQSVLAVLSLSCQHIANIEIDGRSIPLSLYLITVCGSGERKSSCDRVVLRPVEQFEREAHKEFRKEFEAYDIAEDKDGLEKPRAPYVLMQEPTLEAAQKSLYHGRPSQGLFSDEAGQFLGGYAMKEDQMVKTISGFSKFWDGAPVRRDRAMKGESLIMFDRRFAIHLMVQPVIADKAFANNVLQEQGFLARFLIAKPESMLGKQAYRENNLNIDPGLIAFYDRVTELISVPCQTDEDGAIQFKSLPIRYEAKQLWIDYYNDVNRSLGIQQEYRDMAGNAAKIAEQALRIAGVIALYEGEQVITDKHMEGGITLAKFYMRAAINYYIEVEASELQRNALQLREWFLNHNPSGGWVKPRDLNRSAPRPTGARKSARAARELLNVLVEMELASVNHQFPNQWFIDP